MKKRLLLALLSLLALSIDPGHIYGMEQTKTPVATPTSGNRPGFLNAIASANKKKFLNLVPFFSLPITLFATKRLRFFRSSPALKSSLVGFNTAATGWTSNNLYHLYLKYNTQRAQELNPRTMEENQQNHTYGPSNCSRKHYFENAQKGEYVPVIASAAGQTGKPVVVLTNKLNYICQDPDKLNHICMVTDCNPDHPREQPKETDKHQVTPNRQSLYQRPCPEKTGFFEEHAKHERATREQPEVTTPDNKPVIHGLTASETKVDHICPSVIYPHCDPDKYAQTQVAKSPGLLTRIFNLFGPI